MVFCKASDGTDVKDVFVMCLEIPALGPGLKQNTYNDGVISVNQ